MRERAQTQTAAGTPGATRQILASVIVAAMLCGVGILHVAAKVSAVEAGYQLGHLEDEHRLLERENVALKLQLATLRSAAHIETTARTQLGMVTPSAQAVFAVGGPVAPVVKAPPAKSKKPAKGAAKGPVNGGTPVALLAPER